MKSIAIACVAAAGFAVAAEEWTFEVEANAPRVVSCKVSRDWPARMAAHDVAAVDADGVATPVPWTLDTTGDQPELVFLAAGNRRLHVGAARLQRGIPREQPVKDILSRRFHASSIAQFSAMRIGAMRHRSQHQLTGR